MQLFGIGPLELILILVIAVIVLGPNGIVTAAREAGKLIRKIIRSPLWREVVDTSNELRDLPQKIVREAGIEKDLAELHESTRSTIRDLNQSSNPTIKPVTVAHHKKAGPDDPRENEKEDSA